MDTITTLAYKWLTQQTKSIDIDNVEILPFTTHVGEVVYFYDSQTGKDLDYFITVPMFKELKGGKDPKKVINKYK